MKIQTDSYFVKGYSHDICQDYASHGKGSDVGGLDKHMFMVADGCSSALDVDFGARFLCKAAYGVMIPVDLPYTNIDDGFYDWFRGRVISDADCCSKLLGMSNDCLISTLLFGVTDGKSLYLIAYGDGYIFLKMRSGEMLIHRIKYSMNAPVYPSYYLRPGMVDTMLHGAFKDNVKTITTFSKTNFVSDAGFMPPSFVDLPADATTIFVFDAEDVEYCFLASDGFESFYDPNTLKHEFDFGVVETALTLKNHTGDFAKRRFKAFMRNMSSRNIRHDDDVSIAGVYFEQD